MYRLIYQDGDTPQAYTFTEGEVTIGRSPDCQIVLKEDLLDTLESSPYLDAAARKRVADYKRGHPDDPIPIAMKFVSIAEPP